jgi:hypothetical protein
MPGLPLLDAFPQRRENHFSGCANIPKMFLGLRKPSGTDSKQFRGLGSGSLFMNLVL